MTFSKAYSRFGWRIAEVGNKPLIIFLESVHELQKRNYENREKKQLTDNKFWS